MDIFKHITNFKTIASNTSIPQNISYISFEYAPSTDEQLESKKELRDSTIDAIFDAKKVDDYIKAKEKYDESVSPFNPFPNSPGIQTGPVTIMGPKIKNLIVYPNPITSFESIRDKVIQEWISESKKSACTKALTQSTIGASGLILNQIKYDTSDLFASYRKLITKCISSSSLIATHGRIGPATTILANPELINMYPKLNEDSNHLYDTYHIADMIICFTNLVPKDKLYVTRMSDKIDSSSISIIQNTTLNEYYFVKLPNISGNCVELEIV